MQNFSVKSLNHLNQDLFVAPIEDTNTTASCFNIEARSEFQVKCKTIRKPFVLMILKIPGDNSMEILDFWCVWCHLHQFRMSGQLFHNDDSKKSKFDKRISFPTYLALCNRQFFPCDKYHYNYSSFRIW